MWRTVSAPSSAAPSCQGSGRPIPGPSWPSVRRALHAAGFRFRKNVRGLPGTPDVVLPRHGVVVMVHGCFWHGHSCCRVPPSPFWREKIDRNRYRDRRDARRLRALGWRVLTVRECALDEGVRRVVSALRAGPAPAPPPRRAS